MSKYVKNALQIEEKKYLSSFNNLRWEIVSFSKQYELLYIQKVKIKNFEQIKEIIH